MVGHQHKGKDPDAHHSGYQGNVIHADLEIGVVPEPDLIFQMVRRHKVTIPVLHSIQFSGKYIMSFRIGKRHRKGSLQLNVSPNRKQEKTGAETGEERGQSLIYREIIAKFARLWNN